MYSQPYPIHLFYPHQNPKEMEEFYSKFDSKELDNKSNIESKFKEFNEKLKSNMTDEDKKKLDDFKNCNNVSSL